jgi:hypothetical protein
MMRVIPWCVSEGDKIAPLEVGVTMEVIARPWQHVKAS